MQHVSGRQHDLPPSVIEDIGRYRHRVFIERLGWRLKSDNGLERDEFDACAAIYVSSRDDSGRINGVARLLPTTSPYLLERVFPKLLEGQLPPRDAGVWELSRFAAMDVRTGCLSSHQACAGHAARLFLKAVEVASQNGAHALVVVTPVVVERLLRRSGFRCVRMGRPGWHENDFIVALRIDCEEVLAGTGRRMRDECLSH